ncbi:MAG: GNAT family N-acetyltransferase [Planctomycetaceae bacterium]|nr:GNAT family N-acetyltransferase [Planctomycetaceae bacterium]
MKISYYSKATDFHRHAGVWLERNEAANNRLLALTTPPGGDRQWYFVCHSGQDILGVAAVAEHNSLLATQLPESAVNDVFDRLVEDNALVQSAEIRPSDLEFVEKWAARSGTTPHRKHSMRLYECREVTAPVSPGGEMSCASVDDLELMASWWSAFLLSVGFGSDRPMHDAVLAMIKAETLYVWKRDGEPVSMAACGRFTRRGVAVFGVYTPPTLRGQGLGSAVSAALTQRLLEQGREFCCLYADLTNSTTNKIYQQIGYKMVSDSELWEFSSG